MTYIYDKYQEDLGRLLEAGKGILNDFIAKKGWGRRKRDAIENRYSFDVDYQMWYSESCILIKQILPDRFREFESLYLRDEHRNHINGTTYKIQDWLLGSHAPLERPDSPFLTLFAKSFNDREVVAHLLMAQYRILESAKAYFDSSLFNITQLVQRDLLGSELNVARQLVEKGFVREAGIVAGVALEGHLRSILQKYLGKEALEAKNYKRIKGLNYWNDLLKEHGLIDQVTWRRIQVLADIRNCCAHLDEREPNKREVIKLIEESEKILEIE